MKRKLNLYMKDKKILITGGSGLVGKYLKDIMPNAIYLSSKDGDLTDLKQTEAIFEKYKPSVVLHLAARVGGIVENMKYQTEYFNENILMNTNVLKCSLKYDVDHFIGMLSTCIFPDRLSDDCYPMELKHMHEGLPTPTNLEYGYSKRCMDVQVKAYNKQYNKKWITVVIPNLYGKYDQFENNDKAHFVTALLKKIKIAKDNGDDSITLFGTGEPLRQFLYTKDLVNAIKFAIDNNLRDDFIIAPPENLSIKQIAETALKSCDAEYLNIHFDSDKPNGQFRKDVKHSVELFPNFKFTDLESGLRETFNYIN